MNKRILVLVGILALLVVALVSATSSLQGSTNPTGTYRIYCTEDCIGSYSAACPSECSYWGFPGAPSPGPIIVVIP